MKTTTPILLAGLSLLAAASASAQLDSAGPYALKSDSKFETGCFGPCACPVLTQAMEGTFRLRFRDVDPLFTNYDVLDVNWKLPRSASSVSIVGGGTYRVGGEFAVQQRMILDLSVGGGPTQRFDSGLVLGGGAFPDLDVRMSLHQGQACTDTVLQVVAAPVNTTSVGAPGGPLVPGIRAVSPNPFRTEARLALSVATSQAAAVDVLDLRGRVVRHLMSRRWVPAGVVPVTWDGRDDAGRSCATGLYFVRAGVGTGAYSTRVVRIR